MAVQPLYIRTDTGLFSGEATELLPRRLEAQLPLVPIRLGQQLLKISLLVVGPLVELVATSDLLVVAGVLEGLVVYGGDVSEQHELFLVVAALAVMLGCRRQVPWPIVDPFQAIAVVSHFLIDQFLR